MQTLNLQKDVIYGPVNSRRLGKSLGINLLPVNVKVCTFDCIYCHYGRTNFERSSITFPSKDIVIQKIENALNKWKNIDYLTFSGNGEPTLHPNFIEIVNETIKLRNEISPDIPIAILSNSSMADNAKIREALEKFDACIMKLDVGDESTFKKINRPCNICLDKIINGLKNLKSFILQCVMVDGKYQNVRGEALKNWIDAISVIKPKKVQIYSTDRPVAMEGVVKVEKVRLRKVAEEIEEQAGVAVGIY